MCVFPWRLRPVSHSVAIVVAVTILAAVVGGGVVAAVVAVAVACTLCGSSTMRETVPLRT